MTEQINNIAQLWWGWMWPMFWQVGVLVGVVWIIDLMIRRRVWPQVRYALWLLVLLKLVLPPGLSAPTSVTSGLRPLAEQALKETLSAEQPMVAAHGEEGELVPASPTKMPIMEPSKPAATVEATSDLEVPAVPAIFRPSGPTLCRQAYAMLGWLAGVLVLTAWLMLRLRQLRRLHRREPHATDPPQWFKRLLADAAGKLNLRCVPQVVLSPSVASPAVFGAFRPVLLMPAEDTRKLSRKELEHVLLHELAHIKRGDLKVHGFYMLLQIVYWFNPLLWLVRRHLQHLRELCCDATVARVLREETLGYRETILETARRLLAKPAEPGMGLLGLFEDSSRLAVRLRWLEKKTWKYRPLRIAVVFAIVAIMSACVLPMAARKVKSEAELRAEFAEQMPLPKLTAQRSYERGRPIVIRCEIPASGWKPTGTEWGDSDENWAWYMRIDGIDHRCDTGIPLFGGGGYNFPLTDCLRPQIDFPAGKYRVAYVYKNVDVVCPDYPDRPVHFDEIVTYEVEFEVVDSEAAIAPEPTFSATLANGVTVELIGVCEHPSAGKQWWRPDGSELEERPYDRIGGQVHPDAKQRAFEFAIKLGNLPGEEITTKVEAEEAGGGLASGGNKIHMSGEYLSDLRWMATSFFKELEACTIKVAVAAGPWVTVSKSHGKSSSSQGTAAGGVSFSKAYEVASGDETDLAVAITVTDDILDRPCRIVAVTNTGELVRAHRTSGSSAGKARQTTVYFKHPPSITGLPDWEYHFQTRPYEWVQFRNVSLRPGVKTDVQIGHSTIDKQAAADARIRDVIGRFWQAVEANNVEKVLELGKANWVAQYSDTVEGGIKALLQTRYRVLKNKIDIAEPDKVYLFHDEAVAVVKDVAADRTLYYYLQKEGGDWRIIYANYGETDVPKVIRLLRAMFAKPGPSPESRPQDSTHLELEVEGGRGRIQGQVFIGRSLGSGEDICLYPLLFDANNNFLRVGKELSMVSDADGRFVFDKVPVGWVSVGRQILISSVPLHGGSYSPSSTFTNRTQVEVKANQTVNIVLGGAGRPVIGRFAAPADYGQAMDFSDGIRALTTAWPKSDKSKYKNPQYKQFAFQIKQDGTFRIEDVPAGRYELYVSIEQQPLDGKQWKTIAHFSDVIEVPEMIESRMDEPLDLGTLQLKLPGREVDLATTVEAEAEQGSRLEFRIIPSVGSDQQSSLTEREFGRYCKDLAEAGPDLGRQRGDEFAWFEIESDDNGDRGDNKWYERLAHRQYRGRTYLLVGNLSSQAMIPQIDGKWIWGLLDVRAGQDSRGRPSVVVDFDQTASKLFYQLTKSNIHSQLAIILDGKVLSAPRIETPVRSRAVITGSFTEQQVDKMVESIRRGMITRQPQPIEVGPKITFAEMVRDLGEVGPGTKNVCEFNFKNAGDALLEIKNVEKTCGCTVFSLKKTKYAPGETGSIKVTYTASERIGKVSRKLFVSSNDKKDPDITLTINAMVALKVRPQPDRLELILKDSEASCPQITLTSVDGTPFSIKSFKSPGNCITASFDRKAKAASFVLEPKVSARRLKKNRIGLIKIAVTHPLCKLVTIRYSILARFKVTPAFIMARNVKPAEPIKREVWISNNYDEDFEIESVSSQNEITKLVKQQKIDRRYKLELEITPPPVKASQTMFRDVFYVQIKDGEKLRITCRGIYAKPERESVTEGKVKVEER